MKEMWATMTRQVANSQKLGQPRNDVPMRVPVRKKLL